MNPGFNVSQQIYHHELFKMNVLIHTKTMIA